MDISYFLGYLRDLVETTHCFLKIMDNMAKNKHIMVSKKSKRRKKVGGKNKKGENAPQGSIFLSGSREANEAKWDEISSDLSRILQRQVTNSTLKVWYKYILFLEDINFNHWHLCSENVHNFVYISVG